MTPKQPMREMKVRRPRKNNTRRLKFHFFLFAALAVLMLTVGLIGRIQLGRIVEDKIAEKRADTLISLMTDSIKTTAESNAGSNAEKRKISNGLSSKTKALKANAREMLISGSSEADAAAYIMDTFAQGAVAQMKEADADLKARVENSLAQARDTIISSAIADTEKQVAGMNTESVRVSLTRNTEHYLTMYYSRILLITGLVFLALALLMGGIAFFGNEDLCKKATDIVEPLDYLLPFFFGVILFTLYPMIRVFIMAFQERYKLTGEFVGWGLGNFRDVISGTGTYLPQAVINTLLYVLFTVPAGVVLSLIIAYLLNQKIKLKALFQTAYFLPMVTSATAVGLVWKFMFNENYGIINWLLSLFNAGKAQWLTDPKYSMPVMVIYGIWDALPMTIILLISGLQNIDDHYYTVAKVDGAHAKKIFLRITVPLLAPTIGLVMIINSISAFKVFNSVIVLFSGYPGPKYNMYTMTYYIYEQLNSSLEYGRAAAASLILFLFIFAFTMLQRFIQRKWTYN